MILDSHWTALRDGAIEIGTLKFISQNFDAFSDIVNNINSGVSKALVKKVINTREREVEWVKKQAAQMSEFVSKCQNLREYY